MMNNKHINNKDMNIPEIGKEYYFFDDGKISPSRCYKAKVLRVVPYDERNEVFDVYDYDCDDKIPKSLKEIHKYEVDDHRQSENFVVLGKGSTKPGEPWLYAEKTDFFVECAIPGYDENNIWFARTVEGGWFSMDIQSSWQGGKLDIDNSIYEDAKKYFEEYCNVDYDESLRQKGELIV